MSISPLATAPSSKQVPCRLAAAWMQVAVVMIIWLALRPRGELYVPHRPFPFLVYAAIAEGLALSMCVASLLAWLRTRSRPAAILTLVSTVLAVAVGADAWLSYRDEVVFEGQVAADRRYRVYVHGWLRDDNCRDNIFFHKKTDSSPGPYTAGFRCKMLDSDFIVGPQGFRRHSTRAIGPGSPIVMCTGGSVAFGMTIDSADRPYPDMLEDVLVGTNPLLADVRVVNAAMPGFDVKACRQLMLANKQLSPAAIVFYEAINYMPRPLPKRTVARNSGIASWIDRCYVRLESLRALRSYSGEEYKKELLRFIRACRSLSATPVLVTFAMPYRSDADERTLEYYDVMQNGQGSAYAAARLAEIHNQMMREAAAETGAVCIDAAGELTGREELFVDSCHFSQEGCRLLAELVAPAVAETLLDGRHVGLASVE
ncbi:MAG TPA: SGNH/GDSL hydrolase family protein [Phycisphaerae bacterium]|nr:SGNH/GDSL hydrolase family protein [Phycisphaerae bacterium]